MTNNNFVNAVLPSSKDTQVQKRLELQAISGLQGKLLAWEPLLTLGDQGLSGFYDGDKGEQHPQGLS